MQLRIYDDEFNFLGITENQTSVIWNRKYYECGDFSVVLPVTDDNIKLYQIGNIVAKRGGVEAGVIEDLQIHESFDLHTITASGRFLSSYMDRRLIRPRFSFSGKVEVAMRTVLDNAESIPLVELGELQGFTDEVTFQATYKDLLAYETKLAKSAGLGYRFRPDFEEKKIYFEVYKGLDKSRNQNDRAFVEFSDKFDNVENAEARLNDQLYKNVAYVGGQGRGDERVYTQVGDDTLEGLARRELFVDAKDIQEEDVGDEPVMEEIPEPPTMGVIPAQPVRGAIPAQPSTADYMEKRSATDGDGNTFDYEYLDESAYNAAYASWQSEKNRIIREYNTAYASWQAERTRIINEYNTAYNAWLAEKNRIISEYETAHAHWESEVARARREYIIELQTRGEQKLEECLFSNSIECGIIPIGNFEYKRDYDLGDIVTVKKTNWDYENVARITEISEVYEHEIFTIIPTLGDALPVTVDWEDK